MKSVETLLSLCARASSLAYACAADAAALDGFDTLRAFAHPRTDTQGFVAANRDLILVAFRGSSSLRDFVTDARFALRDCGGFRLHSGFAAAEASVSADVLRLVLELRDNAQPVVVTGHSLGGALAVLCAWGLAAAGLCVASVITFGQPRVGDGEFAAQYAARLGPVTWRVVNEADLVPRLPGVLLGYRHAGHQLFIDGLGHLENDPPWWRRLPGDLLSLWSQWQRGKLALLADHGMEHYLAALTDTALTGENSPTSIPQLLNTES